MAMIAGIARDKGSSRRSEGPGGERPSGSGGPSRR